MQTRAGSHLSKIREETLAEPIAASEAENASFGLIQHVPGLVVGMLRVPLAPLSV